MGTIDIDEWVNNTEGYTIDHINELVILHFVLGYSEEEAFKTIGVMVDGNDRLRNITSVRKKAEIGFGNNTKPSSAQTKAKKETCDIEC